MPLQKILLRVIALSIFAIFIAAFISYYNKPVTGSNALARNFVTDTTGKPKADSLDTIRFYLPSSKSIILRKEKPVSVPLVKNRKDTNWHIRMDTPVYVKKDTANTSLRPKQ